MPTNLEIRFLSSLLSDLNADELRNVIMHIAEREFGVVAQEILRVKEKDEDIIARPSGSGTGIDQSMMDDGYTQSESFLCFSCIQDKIRY
jgi:hypothetical protein